MLVEGFIRHGLLSSATRRSSFAFCWHVNFAVLHRAEWVYADIEHNNVKRLPSSSTFRFLLAALHPFLVLTYLFFSLSCPFLNASRHAIMPLYECTLFDFSYTTVHLLYLLPKSIRADFFVFKMFVHVIFEGFEPCLPADLKVPDPFGVVEITQTVVDE